MYFSFHEFIGFTILTIGLLSHDVSRYVILQTANFFPIPRFKYFTESLLFKKVASILDRVCHRKLFYKTRFWKW
jgi:hypothetical protein